MKVTKKPRNFRKPVIASRKNGKCEIKNPEGTLNDRNSKHAQA